MPLAEHGTCMCAFVCTKPLSRFSNQPSHTPCVKNKSSISSTRSGFFFLTGSKGRELPHVDAAVERDDKQGMAEDSEALVPVFASIPQTEKRFDLTGNGFVAYSVTCR
jgi:hypothetical protein